MKLIIGFLLSPSILIIGLVLLIIGAFASGLVLAALPVIIYGILIYLIVLGCMSLMKSNKPKK